MLVIAATKMQLESLNDTWSSWNRGGGRAQSGEHLWQLWLLSSGHTRCLLSERLHSLLQPWLSNQCHGVTQPRNSSCQKPPTTVKWCLTKVLDPCAENTVDSSHSRIACRERPIQCEKLGDEKIRHCQDGKRKCFASLPEIMWCLERFN